MLNFCTIFDSNYATRGITMYRSLLRHCADMQLFVVCLDDKLFDYLTKSSLVSLVPVRLSDIEQRYPELTTAKSNRSYVEYIFTLSPVIALYILETYPETGSITTLDADLYFFDNPRKLFEATEPFHIAVTPHDFKPSYRKHIVYGKYNVCFQTFKRNEVALRCLNEWKSECIDWCYDKLENERYADQKYLNRWMEIYPGVKEFRFGSGIAPWNISNRNISTDASGNPVVGGNRVIYYHFHGMRNVGRDLYAVGLTDYRVTTRRKIIRILYEPYLKSLRSDNIDLSNSKIQRRMHPQLGKLVYPVFLADLYKYKKNKLIPVYNLNVFRRIFSYINSLL